MKAVLMVMLGISAGINVLQACLAVQQEGRIQDLKDQKYHWIRMYREASSKGKEG